MKAPALVLGLALGASPVMAPLVVVGDGDTVHYGKATVRLVGFDAPEIGKHARCPKEEALAEQAKAKLTDLMAPSNKPSLRFKKQRDKYGRKLATAFSNHQNIAPIMVKAGLAVPYFGHGPRQDWCEMSRNKYLRLDVECVCGWSGTRKDDSKPCPKCGEAVMVASQRGGRTFDIPKSPNNGRSKKANALPSGGGGGAWAAKNEEMGISGTSIFDPVLCELAYRWFCPPGGVVLDPFAGGSVRGVIASKLGRGYVGVNLSPRQIAANEAQGENLAEKDNRPIWIEGDSRELAKLVEQSGFDFLFTSPPYADLERYSDDPRDLSTFAYPDFREALGGVVKLCADKLAEDRFACFIIGDARDAKGLLYGLPAHLVVMCEDAGLRLYNDAILATSIASLPVRVRKQFVSARKLGRCHQYVQVFVKGDPIKATKAIGEVEFGEPEAAVEASEGGESLGGEF